MKPTLEGAVLRDVLTDELTELPVTGVFVAIGHQPNTDLFKGQLDMEDNGYLITRPGSTYTNVDGRVRLRRRAGPHLPSGHHGGRLGLHGGHRRRAMARGPALTERLARCHRSPRNARGPEWLKHSSR